MAFPQSINFRATLGYVTDVSPEDAELDSGGAGNANYPRTTAQGNTVGWETASSTYQTRDRNAGNDRRIAGINFNGTNGKFDYRVDLPSAGQYFVRLAMGDPAYAVTVDCELFDTSSSLGVLISGSTGAANSFKDAANAIYTAAAWPGSNSEVAATFSTTIARFRLGSAGAVTNQTAHLSIRAAAWSALQGSTITNPVNAVIRPRGRRKRNYDIAGMVEGPKDLRGWFYRQWAPASSGFTGNANITEAGDTVTADGSVLVQGAATITEAGDTVTAAGTVLVQGSATITEANDTITADGTVGSIITGDASITETGDTVTAAGSVLIQGSATITEANDTVTASGSVAVQGSATITETGDTITAAGVVLVSGAANITESPDTITAAGAVLVQGSAVINEAGDTITADGTVSSGPVISGDASITEANDTITASGVVLIQGAANITEAPDTIVASGVVTGVGTDQPSQYGGRKRVHRTAEDDLLDTVRKQWELLEARKRARGEPPQEVEIQVLPAEVPAAAPVPQVAPVVAAQPAPKKLTNHDIMSIVMLLEAIDD